MLVNPRNPGAKNYPQQQAAALGASGVVFVRLEASGIADIDAAMRKATAQGGVNIPQSLLTRADEIIQ